MVCHSCNNYLDAGLTVCPNCGKNPYYEPVEPSSGTLAIADRAGGDRDRVSVMDYWNAGHADDTIAIETAVAVSQDLTKGVWVDNASGPDTGGPALFFPARKGAYKYNGTGMTITGKAMLMLEGENAGSTQVNVPDGVDLFTIPGFSRLLDVRKIHFRGGRNLIRHTYTGQNVAYMQIVQDCIFTDYTGCAVGTESSDMPYWSIKRNTFFARAGSNTMGVCIGGNTDGAVIEDNNFQRNRVHLKLDDSGLNTNIRKNTYLRWDSDRSAGPSVNVWIVPRTSSVNAGNGARHQGNKHGNENFASGDKVIVVANETGGTGRIDSFPDLASDSTGFATAIEFDDEFYGSSANPSSIVYHTTPNMRGWSVKGTTAMAGFNVYVYEARTVPTSPDRLTQHNTAGPFLNDSSGSDGNITQMKLSNTPGFGFFIDPTGQFSTKYNMPQAFPGAQERAGFVNLLTTSVTGFAMQNGSTKTTITDDRGGTDAIELTVTSTGGLGTQLGNASVVTANQRMDRPVYIDVDIARGSSSPLAAIMVTLSQGVSPIHERQLLEVPPTTGYWRRYRIMLPGLKVTGSTISVVLNAVGDGVTGTVQVGRLHVYHAFEPVSFKNAIIANTTGLTSAQIDALPGVLPFDGEDFIYDTTQGRLLWRQNGKWNWVAGTVIT